MSSMRGSASPSTARPFSVKRDAMRAARRSGAASTRLLECRRADAADQFAAIARGGVQIVARVELPGECVERVVERAPLEQRQVARDRPVGDAADREPSGLCVDHRGAGDDREIAVAARELAEGVAVPARAQRKARRLRSVRRRAARSTSCR